MYAVGMRHLLILFDNSKRAVLTLASGGMYTAVISTTVSSLGKTNGQHLTEKDLRSGEQCSCMAKLSLDHLSCT